MTNFTDDLSTSRTTVHQGQCSFCLFGHSLVLAGDERPVICTACRDLPPVVHRSVEFERNGDVHITFHLHTTAAGERCRSYHYTVTKFMVRFLIDQYEAAQRSWRITKLYAAAGVEGALLAGVVGASISKRRIAALVARHVRRTEGWTLRYPMWRKPMKLHVGIVTSKYPMPGSALLLEWPRGRDGLQIRDAEDLLYYYQQHPEKIVWVKNLGECPHDRPKVEPGDGRSGEDG